MAISIDGLVTGIDTESVIQGLLEIQQQQVDRLELRKSEIVGRQSAFKTLEAKILSLRSAAGALSRSSSNPFRKQNVGVSSETSVAATASESAVSGVYQFTVANVARSHQIVTQGLADPEAEITTGTLDLRVGGGAQKTITIDANNNTLTGLVDAINSADAGVTASVLKDASGGANPYRLLLTATATGAENEISLTNNFAASSGSATQIQFDTANPVQTAQDAQITFGSGTNAITAASSTNRFEDVIAGLRIDLLQPTINEEITLTVAQDTEGAVDAVDDFVTAFNDVMDFIDQATDYNTATEEGGILNGNRNASSIQQQLRNAVLNVVPAVNPLTNRLSAVGISVTDQGRLQLNRNELENIVNGNVDGVNGQDLKSLFALNATSDNSSVSFVLGSSRTLANGQTVEIDITQAAERAQLTAATDLAASTVITNANNTIELALDGATETLTLSEGTYTRQELADHLESVIAGATVYGNREASVSLSGDALQITSASYGTQSQLRVVSGTALADLGLTAGQAEAGRSVAGSFIVDGVAEAATGNGRILTGDTDNEFTADLQMEIRIAPGQVVSGSEANVVVTRGIGATLDEVLGNILNTETGTLNTVDEGFEEQIANIQSTIDRQQERFDREQESLIAQFVALESAISQLNSTSSFLSTQLAGLASVSSNFGN